MSIALVWFRQDLRVQDNPALLAACTNHKIIIPIYILDKNSLLGAAQAWWLHYSLESLAKSEANLSAMEREFYASNRRVANLKIKKQITFTFVCTYGKLRVIKIIKMG